MRFVITGMQYKYETFKNNLFALIKKVTYIYSRKFGRTNKVGIEINSNPEAQRYPILTY